MKKIKLIVGILLLLAAGLILFKIFVADAYYVPSPSMEGTIKAGAYIWVWKYPYGARLPRSTSEIPYLSKLFRVFGEWPLWPGTRMPGLDTIRHDDVCLAQFDFLTVVKRIVALPGDTVEINNGLLRVNSMAESIRPTYRYVYTATLNEAQVRSLSVIHASYLGKQGFELTIEGRSMDQLMKWQDRVNAKFYAQDTLRAEGTFPKEMRGTWNRNEFGPLLIPYAGMRINLDSSTYKHYQETIEKYEGVHLAWSASSIIVNGVAQTTYQFKNDYYFLLGDNRMNAIDSRFLGLFPRKNILGRVND